MVVIGHKSDGHQLPFGRNFENETQPALLLSHCIHQFPEWGGLATQNNTIAYDTELLRDGESPAIEK